MMAKDEKSFKTIEIGVSFIPALAIITFMLAAIGANSYTFANEQNCNSSGRWYCKYIID